MFLYQLFIVDIKIVAWLGNQLRPETLFQKDLDIDPFIASTPEVSSPPPPPFSMPLKEDTSNLFAIILGNSSRIRQETGK